MKEKHIEELKNLVGKNVFYKIKGYDGYYYNDSEAIEIATEEDINYYSEKIENDDMYLYGLDFISLSNYYLVTLEDTTY